MNLRLFDVIAKNGTESSDKRAMKRTEIVVAGHICLDILPAFESSQPIEPGKLIKIGPARFATGGAVANAGVALHRLGASVRLVSRIGDDALGRELLATLERSGTGLADGIRVKKNAVTSYSIVISPPGVDRSFLHCSGENDRFNRSDLRGIRWETTQIFHFGYPPIMRKMFIDDGRELAAILRLARRKGALTSLDMCSPDAKSESGKANWSEVLKAALPHVDLFCPSVEELAYMLDSALYRALASSNGKIHPVIDGQKLSRLAEKCLEMGARVVLIKLGDQGLYLKTSRHGMGAGLSSEWVDRELYCQCRSVEVLGTTGSGDCSIAGFLLAVSRGSSPETALTWSTAVGAVCCESPDATSAIVAWPKIERRIRYGWSWLPSQLKFAGWKKRGELQAGPRDSGA